MIKRWKPSDMRQRLFKEKFCKLATKSVEDRSEKISQPMFVKDRSRKFFESWRRSPSKIAPRKFPNRYASKIAQRKILKVGEEVRRRSLRENFPTDVRQRLLKEKFGSWRRSPSKIAPRKFPSRCSSKIAQRKNLKVGEEVR